MARDLKNRRFLARGIGPRIQGAWSNRKFLSLGIGNRASLATGTGNAAYSVFARTPGTTGNSITFRVVVPATTNAGASASFTGNAVTFTANTSAASTSSSTVHELQRVVNSYFASLPYGATTPAVWIERRAGSDGNSFVPALTATSLTGAV